jgi:hypothetical protein
LFGEGGFGRWGPRSRPPTHPLRSLLVEGIASSSLRHGYFDWRRSQARQIVSASAPASSRRDPIPSLRYALLRCTSTVFGVTYRV